MVKVFEGFEVLKFKVVSLVSFEKLIHLLCSDRSSSCLHEVSDAHELVFMVYRRFLKVLGREACFRLKGFF